MNERPLQPKQDAERDLRHAAEEEQLRVKHQVMAAAARSPEDWFDIFHEISYNGFRKECERNDVDIDTYDRVLSEQKPHMTLVRNRFKAHGLPLSDSVDYEGPLVKADASGAPGIVEWPRGMWIEIRWEGAPKEDLRFEGQSALIALSFILWWSQFQVIQQHLMGKDEAPVSRIVEPGTPEWVRYMKDKAADRKGNKT